MADCGCNDFDPCYRIPAEDGWYVFQIYEPCPDCGTPLGIIIYPMDDRRLAERDCEDLPVLEFDFFDGAASFSLLHPGKLKEKMVEFAREFGQGQGPESFAEEAVDACFTPAVRATLEERPG